MLLHGLQAAEPQAPLAASASLQAELLDVKQSPILCSDAVLRIVSDNTQLNRSAAAEPTADAETTHNAHGFSDCLFISIGFWRNRLISTSALFLNYCNWRL